MTQKDKMLYKITKRDIPAASLTASDAFDKDPLWAKFFHGENDREKKLTAALEVPIRLSYRYGTVLAPSERLEGIAAYIPTPNIDMSFWRMLMSGALPAAFRMGEKAGKMMPKVFTTLENDRKEHMKDREFIYLYLLGVKHEFQGQGYGGKLLREVIAESERANRPLYLDTETEENAEMYERFGFKTVKETTLPIINQHMWEMVREVK